MQYERDFKGGVHMLARATLEGDGIRFRYELTNRSNATYDMIYLCPSFTWPVPPQRVEHRGDGITYYNKWRAVDEPLIATLSTDRKWVAASFTHTAGVKIPIFLASLDHVPQKIVGQARRPVLLDVDLGRTC